MKIIIYDDLVKSLKRRIPVIPANPGLGPGQAPESRVSCENRNPVSKMFPSFRSDDVWTPVSTGVTTFYENIICGYLRKSASYSR